MDSLHRLHELGQSVWLDFLDHELIASGELARMVEHDALRGVTSNPTIFQKAIAHSSDYDDLVRETPAAEADARVFERIEIREVRRACDALGAAYNESGGADGFVSIEVSPRLARDTQGSIDEARRLWSEVGRPNLMVKIPGTREGVPAIERCLADGININVTLLFAVDRYVEVAEAFLRALEARSAAHRDVDRIASVASFFVSRVDTKVDEAIDALAASAAADRDMHDVGKAERGRAAIANAKLAYEEYRRIVAGDRWRALAARGARPQRLLWASTTPKNPAYPDVYYADALVGPETVDTMTKETLRAYREHGQPAARLGAGGDDARAHLRALAAMGIDFARLMQELEDEGVQAFIRSLDEALEQIARKRQALRGGVSQSGATAPAIPPR